MSTPRQSEMELALRTIAEFPATDMLLNMDAANMRRIAQDALAAEGAKPAVQQSAPQAEVPKGWKLVPAEPTEAMVDAFENAMDHSHGASCIRNFSAAYSDMLGATPTAPTPAEAPAGQGEARDWGQIEVAIDSYVEGYEMLGESEDGRGACYTPDADDRALLKDAIMGLLADDDFLKAYATPLPAQVQPAEQVGEAESVSCRLLRTGPACKGTTSGVTPEPRNGDGTPSQQPAEQVGSVELREALECAAEWISNSPHGDNCYVSEHYEGDPGDRCNCGKESIEGHLNHVLTLAPLASSAQQQPVSAEAIKNDARYRYLRRGSDCDFDFWDRLWELHDADFDAAVDAEMQHYASLPPPQAPGGAA